jgi:hypothetical protein
MLMSMLSPVQHLLLLEDSFRYRWASISLFLAIWAAELFLDEEDDTFASSGDVGLGLGFPSPAKENGD